MLVLEHQALLLRRQAQQASASPDTNVSIASGVGQEKLEGGSLCEGERTEREKEWRR